MKANNRLKYRVRMIKYHNQSLAMVLGMHVLSPSFVWQC